MRDILMIMFAGGAVQFTFTPSPEANIGVYQLAHYQCSVDHTDVGITWHVNGKGSADSDIIQLGIVTNGAGSSNSSLTIPGYPQYNNTVVRCNAAGFVNNQGYFNFGESTLRIQGKLANVGNLVCKRQQHICATCTWSPPFSLVPIPGYVVNFTKDSNGEISQNFTVDTTWTFCISPSQFGNYTVSVAGSNTAGEGDTSSLTIEMNTESLDTHEYNITAKNVSGNWSLGINIKKEDVLRKHQSHLQVFLHDNTSKVNFNTSDFNVSESTVEVDAGKLHDNKIWKFSFSLKYNNGFLINTSTPKDFTTFDVQDGNLMVMNPTTGEVCFTCRFVVGSQAQGCYIEYKCTRTVFNGNITIVRTSVDASTASKCVTGIYTSNYNVTFYDVEHSNNIYKDAYAVKMTNQSITGLSLVPTSILSVSLSTDVTSSSPSPTTLFTDYDSMTTNIISLSPTTHIYNIKVSSVNVLSVAVAVPIVLSMLSNIIILYFEELSHLCT